MRRQQASGSRSIATFSCGFDTSASQFTVARDRFALQQKAPVLLRAGVKRTSRSGSKSPHVVDRHGRETISRHVRLADNRAFQKKRRFKGQSVATEATNYLNAKRQPGLVD
jgi:hypothetical protein